MPSALPPRSRSRSPGSGCCPHRASAAAASGRDAAGSLSAAARARLHRRRGVHRVRVAPPHVAIARSAQPDFDDAVVQTVLRRRSIRRCPVRRCVSAAAWFFDPECEASPATSGGAPRRSRQAPTEAIDGQSTTFEDIERDRRPGRCRRAPPRIPHVGATIACSGGRGVGRMSAETTRRASARPREIRQAQRTAA
jgi:hypothetical protein